MRRTKEELLDLYRACQAKLDDDPGITKFCNLAKVKQSEIKYYWPTPTAFIIEAGGMPNDFGVRLPDNVVFEDYARVCIHLGKVPTQNALRIAQRELKTRTHTVYSRESSIDAFQEKFRTWLVTCDEKLKNILKFEGWAQPRNSGDVPEEAAQVEGPYLHLYLPACLQYLEVIARGDRPPFESSDLNISTLFERRTADAFRCLGFEIQSLGQGTGRNPDVIALAPRDGIAVIIDAKVRSNGYVLGTEDRKFLDYAVTHGKELQRQGFEKLYLVVIGPSFREPDLQRLTEYLSESPMRSVIMLTATALMRIVEESIRNRSRFSLGDLGKQLFGNKIIAR
jgi:hypothetical protein